MTSTTRSLRLFFSFIVSCLSVTMLSAQTDTSSLFNYAEPKEYEIGGIEVIGNRYTNENALVNLSGLAVGKKITIPGDDIRNAIKKLWKLKLFTDVQIYQTKRIGEIIFLQINVVERPRLSRHYYLGVPKGQHDDLNKAVDRYLTKGSIVTENMKVNAANQIKGFYADKGFINAEINIVEETDSILVNSTRLQINIDKGKKVVIKDILITGNTDVKTGRLKRAMKKTKERRLWVFKPSRYVEKEYIADKQNLIKYYNSVGHRDAIIVRDSVYQVETKSGRKKLVVAIDLKEGNTYRFRNIVFKGNSIYSDELLRRTLGISKGDVYNEDLLNNRLNFDQNGRDVSTLYMDNGYLFFRVTPTEVGIENDSIDMEIRISEGPQATIDKVIIKGNDRTHEHVIRRELRTRPGQKFSRSDIIRSQRQIVNLNYFNPETLGINTPVNPQRGTVDIEYTVEEKPSDQLELSAGWGGGGTGVIGTLGVAFNNFSLRNLLKPETWSPLPQGDGQRLSIRAQTNGKFIQSYSFSFTEPWLGGKKPNSFSVAMNYFRRTNGLTKESSRFERLGILSASVSLGSRLNWPDDYFISQTSISVQDYNISGSSFGFFYTDQNDNTYNLPEGHYLGLTLNQTFSRNSIDDPIFPRNGALLSLSASLTPPYSLFAPNKDYESLSAQDRFKFLEYHKWSVEADWYQTVVGKLVFRGRAQLGFLGTYNSKVGTPPFERFQLGGDGISNFVGWQGTEIISMRGYTPEEINPTAAKGGGSAYNKFTMELRYPLSLSPMSTIYLLGFFQAGNAWTKFKEYDPFDLKRSAGMGLRVFLPMFGTLGFDYGLGFDKNLPSTAKWSDYGRFNIVLGFEPK